MNNKMKTLKTKEFRLLLLLVVFAVGVFYKSKTNSLLHNNNLPLIVSQP
jgi:hypothetical protein